MTQPLPVDVIVTSDNVAPAHSVLYKPSTRAADFADVEHWGDNAVDDSDKGRRTAAADRERRP